MKFLTANTISSIFAKFDIFPEYILADILSYSNVCYYMVAQGLGR